MVARRAAANLRRETGFTYVGLIVLVAIIGLVGAATLKVDSLLRRAAAENELLEIGAAFSEALRSYAAATPPGQPSAPPTLQDLLKDPRFPGTRRHLRKIFVDPVTGRNEWGVLYQGDKIGVLAVYSLSQARPLKVANFDARFPNFENKEHLSEWKFAAMGQGLSTPGQRPPGQPGQPGQPGMPPGLTPVPPATPAPSPLEPAMPPPYTRPEPAEPAPEPAPEPVPEPPPEPAPDPAPEAAPQASPALQTESGA